MGCIAMNFEGSYRIDATPEEVWGALNSEVILAQCIPGCDSVERQQDGSYDASVTLRIGPIKAQFRGSVSIQEIVPLKQYHLEGEGKGGVAGFVKGEARLDLVAENDGTHLAYQVQAQVGGKVAQLGSRMLSSTVQKLSDRFFQNFAKVLQDDVT